MDLQLKGKRALVTGSNGGIGAAIAQALADEGVSVVLHGRNEEKLAAAEAEISGRGGAVASAAGDLSTDAGADDVAARAVDAFGGIDILVNNAGGASESGRGSWFDLPPSDWAATYQSNVISAGRLIHHVVPAMKADKWGRIIQISSAAGIIPTSGQPDYGPSKAALVNMSMGLSKALAGSGITVNTVSPGMIMTDKLVEFLRRFAEKRGWGDDVDRAADYVLKGTGQTVTRIGQVEDIAYAVTMLASPNSGFINGVNLHLDGGGTGSIY